MYSIVIHLGRIVPSPALISGLDCEWQFDPLFVKTGIVTILVSKWISRNTTGRIGRIDLL